VIDIKRITIPVFLVYAGIIHAIGLAVLLPMIVTLPGPGSLIVPETAPVGGDAAAVEPDREATSALPGPAKSAPPTAAIDTAPSPSEPDAKADAPGNIANLLPPTSGSGPAQPAATKAPAPQAKDNVRDDANAAAARKPARQGAKSSARRSVKKNTKIAPFGGAMSGLFTPGSSKRVFEGRN